MRKFILKYKCNLRITTIAAAASVIGAAAGYRFLPLYIPICILPLMIFMHKRQIIYCFLFFSISFSSGIIHKYFDILNFKNIPAKEKNIYGTLVCIDRRTSASAKLLPLTIVKCKVNTGGKTFTAFVKFSDNARVFYGDSFSFSGRIIPPKLAGLMWKNGSICKEIPPRYGNHPLLIVNSCSPEKKQFLFLKPFLLCREYFISKLTEYINDPQIASMAAKMFFGASGVGSDEMHRNFAASGTIHLFSVSGLHVAIIAGIILFLCKFIHFNMRYRIVAAVVLFYVLCSGASLPAVRAGTMIIIWCIMRSMLFYSPGWNALMISLITFAVIDPDFTGTLSAQYSFTVTAALILLAERIREMFQKEQEFLSFMPPNGKITASYKRIFKLKKNSTAVLLSVATAFAAGCGISIFRQNLFATGSIPANLCLIFITPLLFCAMIFKLAAGIFLDFFNIAGAFLLEKLFSFLTLFTAFIAETFSPIAIPKPPLWSIIIFYASFFTMLGSKIKTLRHFSFVSVLAMIFLWISSIHTPHPVITVISSSCDNPPLIALKFHGSETVFIVNIPDHQSGFLAGKLLRDLGSHKASVSFSAGTSYTSNGTYTLSKFLKIAAYMPDGRKPTKAFLKNLDPPEAELMQYHAPYKISADKKSLNIKNFHGFKIFADNTDNGRNVKIISPDGKIFRETLPWYSIPVVWQCEIK